MESVMNWNNKCAYINTVPVQKQYTEFGKSIRVTGLPKRLPNVEKFGEKYGLTCPVSLTDLESFAIAIASNSKDIDSSNSAFEGQVVPNMFTLGKICSVISRVAVGRITDLQIEFLLNVRVGDQLLVEVRAHDSPVIETLTDCFFEAKIRDTLVATGTCSLDRTDLDKDQINPFFALGLFSAMVAELPGPGARFQTLSVHFIDRFAGGMPVKTIGAVEQSWTHAGNTEMSMDLFCRSSVAGVAHATAQVVAANRQECGYYT
jgi:hypothetical protein